MARNRGAYSIRKSIKIQREHWIVIGTFVLVVLVIGLIVFEGHKRTSVLLSRIDDLSLQNDILSGQLNDLSVYIGTVETGFASTTSILEEDIAGTRTSLLNALRQEKQTVEAIEEQVGSFQEEVGEIAGSVATLEKLSKTDPELLQKYSKVFFLNEHFEPPRLVEIPEQHKYLTYKNFLIDSQVWPYLENMLLRAEQDGVEIFVFSAYRSFGTQEALKGQYTVTYGEGTANQFSADQGYSEHQLGTTVDVITRGIDGTLPGFETTGAYTWLLQNAHRYGFVLSYPEDNSFYEFEPWHWRFIGVALAKELNSTNKNFYDLDQREIDEFLVSIFD